MNSIQTLNNAQLLLTTKLTTRLSNTSDAVFREINLEDLLTNIIDPIATSRSLKGSDQIHQLKDLVIDHFMDTSSTIKLVVSVVNVLLLLTIYSQDASNVSTVQDITESITQNIFKTIPE